MCVLIALEDEYGLYREVVVRILRNFRPHLEVRLARPDTLGAAIVQFDPLLVICNRANTVSPNNRPAWFELRPEPEGLSMLCIDGKYSQVPDPTLHDLILAIDKAEELARTKEELGGC